MRSVVLVMLAFLSAPAAAAPTATSVDETLAAASFDVTTRPKNVPSPAKIKALWVAYKTAKQCFQHPAYAPGEGYKLKVQKAADLAAIVTRSPFPAASVTPPNPACTPIQFSDAPEPLVAITINEAYGERVRAVDFAAIWFARRIAAARFEPQGDSAAQLRQTLVAWAAANALSKGINVSWGSKPIDWQVMTLVAAITDAFGETASAMTAEERASVGSWVNRLMVNAARSRWQHTDDHEYGIALTTLVWGLTVGDVDAVQHAIDIYKKAINLMRPDGSHPIDSQRSGKGLDYNARSTALLVMIAAIVKSRLGLDLFSYTVDGRSIHNGVDFVIASIDDPVKTNALYAIGCEDGGDRFGGATTPQRNFMIGNHNDVIISFLPVYAALFPERESAKAFLGTALAAEYGRSRYLDSFGAPPACVMDARNPSPAP